MSVIAIANDQARTKLLKHYLADGFDSDEDLLWYVENFLGFKYPTQSYCAHHSPPAKTLCDLYFERSLFSLVWGSRTSGKTRMVSVLNHLDSMFRAPIEICNAGASLDQANKGYQYYVESFKHPLLQPFIKSSIQSKTTLITGSTTSVITGSFRGFNGPHPQRCLSGDTIIDTPDGKFKIRDLAGKEDFPVYSYDRIRNRFVVANASRCMRTRKNAQLYKVTFDSGVLFATKNHKILLYNGKYKRIENIKPGTRVRAIKRNIIDSRGGYLGIYQPDIRDYELEHRMNAEYVAERKIKKDEVVHYIDEIKHNNRPDNLIIMAREDHNIFHAMSRAKNPFFGKTHTKKVRKRLSRYAKKQWKLYRKQIIAAQNKNRPRGKNHWAWGRKLSKKERRLISTRTKEGMKAAGYNHVVVSIEKYKREDVYDIQVDIYHNFVANGVVVHNCRIDEVELVEWALLQEGLNMSQSNDHAQATDTLSSTRKFFQGTMQRLLDEQKDLNLHLYAMCVWDVIEPCPRQCHDDPVYGNCPIYHLCGGKAHEGKGWYKISDLIKKGLNLTKATFEAQWENKRPSDAPLIYDMFNRETHVKTWEQLYEIFKVDDFKKHRPPADWTHIAGIDFGSNFSFDAFVLEPTTRTWILYYEYFHDTDRRMIEHAQRIRQTPQFECFGPIYGDSAAKQDRIELRSLGVRVIPSIKAGEDGKFKGSNVKGSVLLGIDEVKMHLEVNPVLGRPKFFIVEGAANNAVKEFEMWSWELNDDGKPSYERPMSGFDHSLDSIRYALYSFKRTGARYRALSVEGV